LAPFLLLRGETLRLLVCALFCSLPKLRVNVTEIFDVKVVEAKRDPIPMLVGGYVKIIVFIMFLAD
jgi:hypothetical protein